MKEEPDSLSVPYNFARCFNAQCPQASKCLRHIATQLDTTDYLYISIVNPARYPADGNQCECFKTTVKVHVAWGLKQLLNRIPYEDAVSIRIQLVGHYGKTGYYRFYRGERGLMPKRPSLHQTTIPQQRDKRRANLPTLHRRIYLVSCCHLSQLGVNCLVMNR